MTDELRILIKEAAVALRAAGASEVYLFGSAAKGEIHENSDIDLAVAGLPPEKFFSAMAEVGDILQFPFDLVDLDEANAFTRYLREEGELLRVE